MRLVSMTYFVLEQTKNFNAVVYYDLETASINLIERIENYAMFLKQPLKLEMFVPIDQKGNVLEEPIFHEPNNENEIGNYQILIDEYDEAKEKVLFEGFELVRFIDKENPCYVVSNGENEVTFHIGLYNFSKGVNFAKTIEDLIHIQPILTESAIKQIVL